MATPYPQCILLPSTECLTYLTPGQALGLLVSSETGFVSAIAVLILFCVIIKHVVGNIQRPPNGGWRFFKSPLDVYMLSLLTSDLVQGLGKILDVKWLNEGVVRCGAYCTAQGVIHQIGETSVAQATLAVAVHTFVIVFWRIGAHQVAVAFLVVFLIWLYVILFAVIGVVTRPHGDSMYITPTPFWCWIGHNVSRYRIPGEYIWIWSAALISAFLYIPLFFCLRGNIEPHDKIWWKIQFQRSSKPPAGRGISNSSPVDSLEYIPQASKPGRDAFIMLLYPACYTMVVLPMSIRSWIGFDKFPSAWTFFGTSLFGLSGLVNVVLLLYTRPGLLLLNQPVQPSTVLVTSNAKTERNIRASSTLFESSAEHG